MEKEQGARRHRQDLSCHEKAFWREPVGSVTDQKCEGEIRQKTSGQKASGRDDRPSQGMNVGKKPGEHKALEKAPKKAVGRQDMLCPEPVP